MERYEFCIGEAFPAEDELAQWIASLSMALGDLRTVWTFQRRAEQPDHERSYFVRLSACHMRELVKVLEVAPASRPVLQHFLDETLEQEGRDLYARILELIQQPLDLRPEQTLLDELKRIRDATWHYPLDKEYVALLRDAMRRAAASGDRGAYIFFDAKDADEAGTPPEFRAEYADLFAYFLAYPLDGNQAETNAQFRELMERMRDLLGALALFLQRAEVAYLVARGIKLEPAPPEPS